jgi:glycosyltransferase involved in cell wall biosynthesis
MCDGTYCRLLYLVGQLRPGGLERQLCNLLQTLDRKHYKPAVVVWNFGENDAYTQQIRALDVPLYSFIPGSSAPKKLRKLCRIVRQLRPEVVHSYSFYTNFAAYWATRGTRVVAVGSVRGDFTHSKQEANWWLWNLSAHWPRDQIYNSFSAAATAQCSRRIGVPKRLSVVRNGLDLERFCALPLPANRQGRIVGIGSLIAIKRWDRLLMAASQLKQSGFDFLIQIIGDGPLRGPLEQQAWDLDIADCVEFLGYISDIPSILASAAFLVHPSDSEGCPNVVMEAMACGRAVVATDAGDVPALVEDGKTGFVVRRGDDASLIARMATLITEFDLCRRMGKAGRAKAEREFGVDRLVADTLVAYRAAGWRGQ